MPVTAKLSSRFYEKLGDETTNELVNWLNAVDAEFRTELRERDERNWDRFRADMARQSAELRTEIAELRTELKGDIGILRAEMHSEIRSQFRWMFTFWITTLLAIFGLRLF